MKTKKFKSAKAAEAHRKNAESWKKLLEKYEIRPKLREPIRTSSISDSGSLYRREPSTNTIPSLDTGVGVAPKKKINQYTGDAMIGIGQMHKSNAVPIFSKKEAVDISNMRRN